MSKLWPQMTDPWTCKDASSVSFSLTGSRHHWLTTANRAQVVMPWCAAILSASIWCSPGAWASDVRIVENLERGHLVIEATDAAADEILAALAARFDFTVERAASVDMSRRNSLRLQGSLQRTLERLLSQENYVVVSSSERRGGISRIQILDSKGGTQSAASSSQPSDGSAKSTPLLQFSKAHEQPAPKVESDRIGSTPNAETKALTQYDAELQSNPEVALQLLMMNGVSPELPSSDTGGGPSAEGMAALAQLAESKVRALSDRLEKLPGPSNEAWPRRTP